MTLYDKNLNEIAQGEYVKSLNTTKIKAERTKYITNNIVGNNTAITNGSRIENTNGTLNHTTEIKGNITK